MVASMAFYWAEWMAETKVYPRVALLVVERVAWTGKSSACQRADMKADY